MQLSTPWFRLPVGPTAQEWWKQHGREFPRPSEEPSLLIADGYKADEGDASDEKPMVEPGTFEWIKAEKGEYVPCVAFDQGNKLGDLWYDLDSVYEEAREKFDASLSPHTASGPRTGRQLNGYRFPSTLRTSGA